MAGINLRGETSGSVEIASPAVAGDTTITLPTTNGTLVVEQTDRVSFASSVGIGTTQPEHALVVADTAVLSRIRIRNDTASSGRYASLNLKTAGFDNGWSIYSEYNSSDTNNYLKIFKGDGTGTHMYFKDPAEVGIRSAFYHVDSNGSDNGDSCFGFVSTSSNPGFKIKSGGTERFNVTSDGQLQATGASDVRLTLGSGGTAGTNDSVHMRADGANLLFMNADGGITKFEQNGAEAFQISTSGNIKFTDGKGIDFSSASGSNAGSSNAVLDDYEEGVYTPVFTCGSGSITLNTSFDIIAYEKIGNCCHVHGRVRVSSVSSPGGALTIGLPFTRSNPGEDSARIGGTIVVQNGSSAVVNYLIHPTGATGAEVARGDTSSIDTTVADNFSGDELVYISITYRTT